MEQKLVSLQNQVFYSVCIYVSINTISEIELQIKFHLSLHTEE